MSTDWRRAAGLWTAVFAANLPVLVAFAVNVAAGGGWVGMLVAGVAYWLAGLVVVQLEAVRPILLVGSAMVALTQIFPLLHVVAAVVAANLWERLSGERLDLDGDEPTQRLSEVGGFVVMVLMCGLLLVVAAACATVARLVAHRQRNRTVGD